MWKWLHNVRKHKNSLDENGCNYLSFSIQANLPFDFVRLKQKSPGCLRLTVQESNNNSESIVDLNLPRVRSLAEQLTLWANREDLRT
jgi:hypothetical protein